MLCRIPFGADEETKNEGYSVSGSITISTLPAISMTFAFAQAFVSTSNGEFDVSAFRTDVGALLGHVAKVVCSGSVRVASDGLFRSKPLDSGVCRWSIALASAREAEVHSDRVHGVGEPLGWGGGEGGR